MRRIAGLSIAIALASATILASPAHAADHTVSVICAPNQGLRAIQGVMALRGETVTFNYTGCRWVHFGGSRVIPPAGLNSDSDGNDIPESGSLTVSIAPYQPGETCCNVSVIAIFAPNRLAAESDDRTIVSFDPGSGAIPAPNPTPSSTPTPARKVEFVRDKNCANSGTFIIRGVPGKQRLLFAAAWTPDIGPPFSPVYGGFEYTGRGGSKPSVWRIHLVGPKVFWGKMPTKMFMISGVFRTGRLSPIYDFAFVVPACT